MSKTKDWSKILKEADEEQAKEHVKQTESSESHDITNEDQDLLNQETILPELNAEVDEATKYKNELLYIKAEFENFKKRHQADIDRTHKYAVGKFLESLLPVMDSVETSLESLKKSHDTVPETVIAGLELTAKLFKDTLERQGVQQIDPLNQMFDPNLHEAMSVRAGEGAANNQIVDVLQKGYLLNGRVVRAALVVIAKN